MGTAYLTATVSVAGAHAGRQGVEMTWNESFQPASDVALAAALGDESRTGSQD
jgi:hypothetical protein